MTLYQRNLLDQHALVVECERDDAIYRAGDLGAEEVLVSEGNRKVERFPVRSSRPISF
jgi:hypothetical protein